MLTLLHGDALTKLAEVESESVQTCVTSPPYWGLRDYGVEGQLGLEKTPEEYVAALVEIFREVKRVLRKDGTLWLNLGDSYAGGGNYRGIHSEESLSAKQRSNGGARGVSQLLGSVGKQYGCKPKDLVGIPWLVALALRADGWYLRSDTIEEVELYCPCGCGYVMEERIWRHSPDRDIIWSKPNPMPESVTDRPTKSHEYIFLLSKSAKYYYDAAAIAERISDASIQRINQANFDNQTGGPKDYRNGTNPNRSARKALENFARASGDVYTAQAYRHPQSAPRGPKKDFGEFALRNKRSVWTVTTKGFPDAHFATFPPDLIIPCILAGTSAKGACVACGSPWERVVERSPAEVLSNKSEYGHGAGRNDGGRSMLVGASTNTLGWQPMCKHNNHPAPCVVLDPFAGSGTTGKVAIELGRRIILIEPKDEYVEMIEQRCRTTIGLPLVV